jgi:hypothetical protein
MGRKQVDVTAAALGCGAVRLEFSCDEVSLSADLDYDNALRTAAAILNCAGIRTAAEVLEAIGA